MGTAGPSLCPSMRCEEGSLLLGVIQADQTAAFLPSPLPVDAAFVAIAQQGRAPERRFRFAGPCREGACRQWQDGRCGVADLVTASAGAAPGAAVPACAIRTTCRWWAQSGPAACGACRFVITDLTLEHGALE